MPSIRRASTPVILFLLLVTPQLANQSGIEPELRLEWVQTFNTLGVDQGGPIFSNPISDFVDLSEEDILYLLSVSSERGVPLPLFLALIEVESAFDPKAINRYSGARGLGQFMPNTAKWLAGEKGLEYSEELLLEAQYNISLMGHYLQYLYDQHKDWRLVLSLYGGYGKNGRYSDYTEKVLDRSSEYAMLTGEAI